MKEKDDVHFLQLWDLYSPLLTKTQQEITDLYFNYDLSLGEIAEQKGVSRQSVSDCLQTCRKQLEKYDEKLGFSMMLTALSLEYSAYRTVTEAWIAEARAKGVDSGELDRLAQKLQQVDEDFDLENVEADEED